MHTLPQQGIPHVAHSQLAVRKFVILELLPQLQLVDLASCSVGDLFDKDNILRDPPLSYFTLHKQFTADVTLASVQLFFPHHRCASGSPSSIASVTVRRSGMSGHRQHCPEQLRLRGYAGRIKQCTSIGHMPPADVHTGPSQYLQTWYVVLRKARRRQESKLLGLDMSYWQG